MEINKKYSTSFDQTPMPFLSFLETTGEYGRHNTKQIQNGTLHI
jgi:hypothetical protein